MLAIITDWKTQQHASTIDIMRRWLDKTNSAKHCHINIVNIH